MEKNVLVTGASSGIGRATAILFNEMGYRVHAAARRVEKMNDLAKLGIKIHYMDIEYDPSMEEVVDSILTQEGKIDILINNAGFAIYGTVEDVPMAEAKRQFEVNVFGLVRMAQMVLPSMRNQGAGTIVNLSSVAGRMSMPLGGWYHASKHAVEALSDSLRGEVNQFGVNVIIIEPGIIDTAWWPIAESNLRKVSEHTSYRDLVDRGISYLEDPGKASRPEIVAQTILKAVEDKNPKARYLVGEKAHMIVMAEQVLSDRQFDKLMDKQLQMAGKEDK